MKLYKIINFALLLAIISQLILLLLIPLAKAKLKKSLLCFCFLLMKESHC